MKFGSIFTIGSLCITGLVNAAPTTVNKLDQRDLDLESLIQVIEQYGALEKRDDNAFANELIAKLGSSYLGSLVDQLSDNPEFKQFMSSGAISTITDGKYNATYVLSLLKDENLIPSVMDYLFADSKHRRDATDLARRMWEEGLVTIDETQEVVKREPKVSSQPPSALSKRDNDYISAIVDKLSSSNLLSSLSNGLLNSDNLQAAESYLKTSLSKVNVSELVNTVKSNPIGSKILDELKSSDFLQEEFSKIVSGNIKRGLIAREDVAGSSASQASTADLLSQLFYDTPSTTVTATALSLSSSSSSSSASTTGGGFLDGLFGGGGSSSSSRSSSSTAAATTSESLLDKLLGDTGKNATTTKTSASSTATGESLGDLLGGLFKPSNSTKTSSSAKSTGTSEALSDLLDDLFGGSSSSNSTNKGGSGSGTSLSSLIGGLLDDIFGGSSNSTSGSSSGSGTSLSSLLSGLLDDLFGGSGSSSASGSGTSLSSLLGNIIDKVVNWLFGGNGVISDLINKVLNWLFSPSSSGGSSNIGSLLGSAIDWLIDALFDGDGSSSSSSSSSGSSGTSSGTSAKQCCCNKKSKMVKKRELKDKLKRNLHNHLRKRAADFDFSAAEAYIKYL